MDLGAEKADGRGAVQGLRDPAVPSKNGHALVSRRTGSRRRRRNANYRVAVKLTVASQ